MSRRLIILAVLTAAILTPATARADLRVVATVPDLAALAREVGGNHAKVDVLSLHTQDPHFVDAKPSLVLAVNKADMLIAVGLDLEIGWLPVLQKGARNGKIQNGSSGYVDCSQFVNVLEVPRTKIDRSMGDVHPGGNPHYLYDPRRGKACAAGIAARMIALDPEHAADYKANLDRFEKKIEPKIAEWDRRMAPYKGTAVVTYHKSWSYVIDWFGFDRVDNLEPVPGIAPNPRHLAKVIKAARARNAKLLFEETYYPSRTASLVANKIGARMLTLAGGTNVRGGESYVDRIDRMVKAIEAALK